MGADLDGRPILLCWEPDEAVRRIAELSKIGVELVEQPVPAGDVEAMGYVRSRSDVPIFADESCPTSAEVRAFGGSIDGVVVKLMKCGGLVEAVNMIREAGGLYVSVLVDPTTGGTTASIGMLADVILAEPGAMIGFAGPRVIANTIRQELPDGFQRAEFLLEHGFVDIIVERKELRSELARLVDYCQR